MTAKKPAKPNAAAPAAADEAPKPKGRPSSFSPEIAEQIIERLSKGEPLAQICRDEGMPAVRTVSDWKAGSERFSADFARAREEGFDAIAAECLDIADDGWNDKYIDDNGNHRTDTDVVQRSKLRIETRLKLLAKWDPKRYGEKIAIGGADDLPPIKKMADGDLDAAIAKLMGKADGSDDEG